MIRGTIDGIEGVDVATSGRARPSPLISVLAEQ
jgi:hypothetical protein